MLQAKLSISDRWYAGDQGPRIQRGHDHGRRNTLWSNERRYEKLQVECNNCYKFGSYAFGQEPCAQLVDTSWPLVFLMGTTRIQILSSLTIKL